MIDKELVEQWVDEAIDKYMTQDAHFMYVANAAAAHGAAQRDAGNVGSARPWRDYCKDWSLRMAHNTPGPWAWDDAGTCLMATRNASSAWIIWPRNISCESDARVDGWASVLGSPNCTDVESEANARLIAAAPDLLNALISCIDVMETEGFDKEVAAARAAITKATGETK